MVGSARAGERSHPVENGRGTITPRGMANVGNTCFLNAAMQVWATALPRRRRVAVQWCSCVTPGSFPPSAEHDRDARSTTGILPLPGRATIFRSFSCAGPCRVRASRRSHEMVAAASRSGALSGGVRRRRGAGATPLHRMRYQHDHRHLSSRALTAHAEHQSHSSLSVDSISCAPRVRLPPNY